MRKVIDLRSDTVTQPTKAMRDAMYNAVVGDDIMGEDPTVRELELLSANILGKEDGLFVSSGTMANQIAVMAFTNRGEEIILGDTSHMLNLESGGLAALSQVQTRPIPVSDGFYDLNIIKDSIQEEGVQRAKTGLIAIENTNDLNAGLVVPVNNIEDVCNLGKEHNIPVYMDGARIFNAAIALNIEVKEIVKDVDAVMFALTKGLAAPFGAVLLGEKNFIEKARWLKQRIGGGYRQAGFIAAPGIVALKTMMGQIGIDHNNAKVLGKQISKIEGLQVDRSRIHTNIVTASIENPNIKIDELLEELLKEKVKVKKITRHSFRMVTHYGIEEEDVIEFVKILEQTIDKIKEK